jgi:hypothetical protein
MKKFLVVTIAMLFSLGFASVANAGDYTYTYTGTQLFFQSTGSTICYDPPFGGCGFISGDFTLATPLPTNFTGQDSITPIAYSFTNNSHDYLGFTLNSSNSSLQFFVYATNAQGAITAWSFGLAASPAYCSTCSIGSQNAPWLLPSDDWQADNVPAFNYYSPGTWSVSPLSIPEPSALILLIGTGLAAAIGVVRQRLRRT